MDFHSNYLTKKNTDFFKLVSFFLSFLPIFQELLKLFTFFLSGKFIKSNKFYKLTGKLKRRRTYK